MYHLVVKHPFKNYQLGELIKDKKAIEEIMKSANSRSVLRILAPKGGK